MKGILDKYLNFIDIEIFQFIFMLLLWSIVWSGHYQMHSIKWISSKRCSLSYSILGSFQMLECYSYWFLNNGCVVLPWHFEFYILKCSKKIFTLQNVKFYILKCQGRTTQPLCIMMLANQYVVPNLVQLIT